MYLGGEQRRLGRVLVHGVAHDVVGIAGQPLHGRIIELTALLRLHDGLLHVGRVGHGEGQGVVARGGAGLRGFAQSSSPIGEPHLSIKDTYLEEKTFQIAITTQEERNVKARMVMLYQ